MDLGRLGGSGGKETSNAVPVGHGVQPKDAPRGYYNDMNTRRKRRITHFIYVHAQRPEKSILSLFKSLFIKSTPQPENWQLKGKKLFSKN